MTDIRVATMNVKGGLSPLGLRAGGRRGGLGQSQDRMTEGIRRANQRGITVATLQEFSALQAARVADDEAPPRWGVIAGTPNVERVVRGQRVTLGNGVMWRKDLYDLARFGEVAFEMPEGVKSRYEVPDFLHFPFVVLEDIASRKRFEVLGIHFLAGRTRSAQAAKEASAALVADWAQQRVDLHPRRAIVVAGDRNSANLLDEFSHVEHVVDYVGSPSREVLDPILDEGYRGLVSDHASISGIISL